MEEQNGLILQWCEGDRVIQTTHGIKSYVDFIIDLRDTHFFG
jgi:hypothetical protein